MTPSRQHHPRPRPSLVEPREAELDVQPADDVNGMPTAAAVVVMLIGIAIGMGIAGWLQVMHAAGTGRGLW